MFGRTASASLFAIGVLVSVARADAIVSSDNDKKCVLRIGPDLIHVTAYQAHDPRDEFCKDIPSVGPVTIVLDYVDAELRNMTADIRVIKDVAGASDASATAHVLNEAQVAPEALDPVTETHLPAKLYPNGTINFQHTFTSAGNYHGIVTVRNSHGQIYVSQFPFSVGRAREKAMLFYGAIAVSIVGGAFLYWFYTRGYDAIAGRRDA